MSWASWVVLMVVAFVAFMSWAYIRERRDGGSFAKVDQAKDGVERHHGFDPGANFRVRLSRADRRTTRTRSRPR